MAEPVIETPAAAIHAALGGGVVAAVMGWLPQVLALGAAFIGACYYTICIWESKTVQHWINNRRMVRKGKLVAKLKAKEKRIIAQLEALELVRAARRAAVEKLEVAEAEAAKLVAQATTETAIKHTPPRDPPDARSIP